MSPVVITEDEVLAAEVAAYDQLVAELAEVRAAVVASVEQHVSLRERASALYERACVSHSYLLKQGVAVARPMAGCLPGGTREDGIRVRWLQAIARRW